ncbi:SH3 domain-containing protein [Neomegalonema sp.]|uniref:SH3 domain-containing protein n=1 Tax=Neomegalonema sp. TaxID=2039713 RepID=UPI00263160B6|nr:SH3 domain-containing protein [Neomegalonema sp.]MDD2868291.1 SH3 domain-containing protein [Neomegalonema sp.]
MTRRPLLLLALCATALAAPALAQQRPDPNAVQNLLNQFPHLTGAPQPAPAPAPVPTLDQALGAAIGQAFPQQQQPASPLAGTVGQLFGQPQAAPAQGGLAPLDLLLGQQQQQLAPPAQLFGGASLTGQPLADQALGALLGQQQQQLAPPAQLFGQQAQPASPLAGTVGQLLGIPQQAPQGAAPGQPFGQPQFPQQPPAAWPAPQGQQLQAPQPLFPPPSQTAPYPAPAPQPNSTYLGGASAPAPAPAPVAAAAPARSFFGFPRYARVSGVPANDTLKVRAEPRAQAQQLGELRPESNTLEVLETNADESWSRILWQGGDAWVSSRYLSPVEPARIRGSRAPVGLHCSGTEPFWSLKIEDERTLSFSSPENPAGTRLGLSSVSPSPNGDATLFNALPAGPERFTAIIAPAQCSDGMSEATYGWRVDLIRALEGPGAPPPSLFGGCCRLPS